MLAREFLKKEKLGVLCGGMSDEREVSLKTGQAVYDALKNAGYDAELFDVDRDIFGRLLERGIKHVFLALHGKYGEDGTIQGGLELSGIRYTGCGVLASALTMDKHFTKKIFRQAGIPTPDWVLYNYESLDEARSFSFPAVIKPRFSGSALGVKIVHAGKDFNSCFDSVKKLSRDFLLEQYIDGTEITVGFLGDKILPAIEIVPKNEFYDFEAKYAKGGSDHIIPARISSENKEKAEKIVRRCIKEFELTAVSRIDMKISSKNELFVLEINTIPGMTGTSLLPDAAKAAGIDFVEMLLTIMDYSFL